MRERSEEPEEPEEPEARLRDESPSAWMRLAGGSSAGQAPLFTAGEPGRDAAGRFRLMERPQSSRQSLPVPCSRRPARSMTWEVSMQAECHAHAEKCSWTTNANVSILLGWKGNRMEAAENVRKSIFDPARIRGEQHGNSFGDTSRRSAQSLSLLRAMSTPLLDDGMVYRTSSWKEKLVDEMIKVRDLPEPED